jgi:hypothetical protein
MDTQVRRRPKRDKTLSVSMTEAEMIQLRHLAEARGLDCAAFVRLALFHTRGLIGGPVL